MLTLSRHLPIDDKGVREGKGKGKKSIDVLLLMLDLRL